MSSLAIASIVFVCVFSSGLVGLFVRASLPSHHLSEDSTGVVKLGTGLLATLSALVLGLLIASAKTSFDKIKDEVTQAAAKIVQLDRVLAQYGPETKESRNLIREVVASALEVIFSEERSSFANLDAPERLARVEAIQVKLRELTPQNDAQRALQHALHRLRQPRRPRDGALAGVLRGRGDQLPGVLDAPDPLPCVLPPGWQGQHLAKSRMQSVQTQIGVQYVLVGRQSQQGKIGINEGILSQAAWVLEGR